MTPKESKRGSAESAVNRRTDPSGCERSPDFWRSCHSMLMLELLHSSFGKPELIWIPSLALIPCAHCWIYDETHKTVTSWHVCICLVASSNCSEGARWSRRGVSGGFLAVTVSWSLSLPACLPTSLPSILPLFPLSFLLFFCMFVDSHSFFIFFC